MFLGDWLLSTRSSNAILHVSEAVTQIVKLILKTLTRYGFSTVCPAHYYRRVIFLTVQSLAHLLEAVWGTVPLNRTEHLLGPSFPSLSSDCHASYIHGM